MSMKERKTVFSLKWPTSRDLLSFSTQIGPVQLWSYANNSEPYQYFEDYGYSSPIITYRWHPTVPGRLVVGHDDGKITVYREGEHKIVAFTCELPCMRVVKHNRMWNFHLYLATTRYYWSEFEIYFSWKWVIFKNKVFLI